MNNCFRKKTNNLPILIILLMMMSGVLSTCFVLADVDRPAGYQFLWLLPTAFIINCFLLYPIRKQLFTRVSVTLITGIFWMRMVVSPIAMVLGNYAVVPENTSWHRYLTQAFFLESYEAFIVFMAMLIAAKYLSYSNCNPSQEKKKMRYSLPFYMAFGCVCLFFFGMIADCPDLIRYQFITILGAPPGWKVVLEQRSLNGSGSGPLGILVTLWTMLITVLQVLLPPYLLTWIFNHRKKWSDTRVVIASLFLVGCVFVIATESRANSVITALALLCTTMAYSNKKQLRWEVFALILLGVAVIGALCWKTINGRLSVQSNYDFFSFMITAYFSGPQNVAASIEATELMGGPHPQLFLADMNQAIPFLNSFLQRFVGINTDGLQSTNTIFNHVLYGMDELLETDQIVPSIGQGCMIFGYALAPLFSVATALAAVWFEYRARLTDMPVWKNLCYVGAIYMSMCQSISNFAIAIQYLWFVGLAAVIAVPMFINGKRVLAYEFEQTNADGFGNMPQL